MAKELAIASRQHTVSHFLLRQRIFDQKQHNYLPPLNLIFSVSPIKDETEGPLF
jgi:hypothetical protein